MEGVFKPTLNLGNSIIGVGILAMPYCIEKVRESTFPLCLSWSAVCSCSLQNICACTTLPAMYVMAISLCSVVLHWALLCWL